MPNLKEKSDIDKLYQGIDNSDVSEEAFFKKAKKISSELKNNKAKNVSYHFDMLHKLIFSNWNNLAKFELINHLLILAVIRCEFDRLGLARTSFCHISNNDRSQISLSTQKFLKGLPISSQQTIAYKVMACLMTELIDGQDEELINLLNGPTFDKNSYKYVMALEEGITSYVASSSVLKDFNKEEGVSLEKNRNCTKWVDDLDSIELSAVFQFSIESVYLLKYWPTLSLVIRWITASGAGAIINFIVKEGEEVSSESEEILNIISKAQSSSSNGGLRINIESVRKESFGRPYFASSRFIAASSLAREFNCPIFFPDVEVLPQRDLTAFLKKIEDTHFVFGSNNGVKTIFPWRRWLATELVAANKIDSKELIEDMSYAFEECLVDGSGWFVDQNVIYFLEKKCQKNNINALRTDKASIGLPLLQSGVARNM